MAYKRALWKSGLTYEQVCEQCHTKVRYTDNQMDYRPWFADGFVYCPNCQKPLRHNEKFAVNNNFQEEPIDIVVESEPVDTNTYNETFCPNCGKKFNVDDCFCSGCGRKRM